MVVSLSSLRDETLERLLSDPPLVWQVIAPDDPESVRASASRSG
jgi:hypothetical protein